MRNKTGTNEPNISPASNGKVNCISCGAVVHKNYCENCGEKRLTIHDFAFAHYAEEWFEGFTHFDNKFFNSVKTLLAKPGLLSLTYFKGKRVPYMRPFALFFVCNVLFFLLVGQSNVFSLPLDSFYHYSPYTNFHSNEIINRLVSNDKDFAIVASKFNDRMGVQSKAFLAFFIPFLALGGLILKRKTFLSAHLVFSTHFFTFIVLYYTFTSLLISNTFYYLTKQTYNSTFDLTYSLFSLLVFAVYYGIAAKRFYSISRLKAIIGAIITPILFVTVLYAYRFTLFFKIINTVKLDF